MINLRKEIKEHEKENRLLGLQTRYFQLQMDLACYEANEDTAGAERTKQLMESCEKSYAAVKAIEIEEGGCISK